MVQNSKYKENLIVYHGLPHGSTKSITANEEQ